MHSAHVSVGEILSLHCPATRGGTPAWTSTHKPPDAYPQTLGHRERHHVDHTLGTFFRASIYVLGKQNIFIFDTTLLSFYPLSPSPKPQWASCQWLSWSPPTHRDHKAWWNSRYDLPTLVSYVSGHFWVFVVQITLCVFSLKSLGQVLTKRFSLTPPPMYVGYLSISNITLSVLKIRPRVCTQPDRAPTFRQRAASQAGQEHETGEGYCLLPSTHRVRSIAFLTSISAHCAVQRETWWKSV